MYTTSSPKPVFEEPAPHTIGAADIPIADAVLNPFEVYAHGDVFLRAKLSALSSRHLVDIIVAYELSDEPAVRLEDLSTASLIELIIYAVRVRSQR